MRFIITVLLLPIAIVFSKGQTINLPQLQEVEKFQRLPNSIALQVFLNEKDELNYKIDDAVSAELDSLKGMLLKSLNTFSSSTLDNGFVKILVSADKSIKMADMELLLQELARLNLNKVIFEAQSEKNIKIDWYEKLGIECSIHRLSTKEAKAFYTDRNLPFKKFENLPDLIVEKRRIEAAKLNPSSDEPPIPEPKEEIYIPSEEEVKKRHPKATIINIEIGTKKKIKVNGKKIKLDDLNDFVFKKAKAGKCIFIIATKRKASYENYLKGTSVVLLLRQKMRDFYAKEVYQKHYDRLDWRQKKIINKKAGRLLFFSRVVE